jgi:hypothetical protein
MNNQQVAHLWASGNKASGKGSNFYFEGDTIYSYGSHFPIARRINEGFYLITKRGYSVSTAKHISYARRAIPSYAKTFPVTNSPRDSFGAIREEKMKEARNMFSTMEAKTPAKTYENACGLSLFIRDTLEMFRLFEEEDAQFLAALQMEELHGILGKVELVKEINREAFEIAEAKKDAQREAREAKRRAKWERQQELERMEALEIVPLWRNGEKVITWKLRNLPPMLRIIGDKVETSHGAEVTREEATRAFSFIVAKINRGETWHRNGETCAVGPFSLVSIDSETVTVGCHKFTLEEVLDFGKLIA